MKKEKVVKRKSTGIEMLDRYLNGGLPGGSVVLFSTDPKSMSEVFLYHFATAQKSHYFATDRDPKYIKQNIIDFGFNIDNTTFVDVYGKYRKKGSSSSNNTGDKAIIKHFSDELEKLRKYKDFTCVIDTFSFFLELDSSYGRMKELVNQVYDITKETDSVSYLYILKGVHDPKVVNSISNTCDIIFDIESERVGDKVTNKLLIPKIRGVFPAPTQLIKYQIRDDIQIDTSMYLA
ncbi:MAG: hypothetical protein IB616_02345 [Methanosarcinales archaeon]|nr:MAG: hypothetical protein IB616_02345 [Methanosarcinales archaeon]